MKFLLSILLVVAIGLLVYFGLHWLKRKNRQKDFRIGDREAWSKRWSEIEQLTNGGATHLKVAIIDSDQLLDYVLKSMHLPGDDTGQRLKFIVQSRPELRYIYEARRLRNRLVHEAHFQLNEKETRRAVGLYKKILKDLGVL